MNEYNGHRSWNAWNVSLWIGDTLSIYNFALYCLRNTMLHGMQSAGRASTRFMKDYAGQKTPDGAKYNHLAVKLCLQGFIDD